MPWLERDGIRFHYIDRGAGAPLVFQHGLSGDLAQALEAVPARDGLRLIAMDARGHGETRPLGPVEALGFDTLAADALALMDHLGVERAVVGGISMGAGVALNLALRAAGRVRGLILVRPAWLDEPMPAHLEGFALASALIAQQGAVEGGRRFRQTPLYQTLARAHPYAAESFCALFEQPRAEETAVKLARMAGDAPTRDRAAWGQIGAPTLVVGCQADYTHPFALAETLAAAIPGAELREIPAKSLDKAAHFAQLDAAVRAFWDRLA